MLVHGKISPPSDLRHEHAAPVATPHLPITATTKVAEMKRPASPGSPAGSPPSPVSEESPLSQSAAAAKQGEPAPAGDWCCQLYRLASTSKRDDALTFTCHFFCQHLPRGLLRLPGLWGLHACKVSSSEDHLPHSKILSLNVCFLRREGEFSQIGHLLRPLARPVSPSILFLPRCVSAG